MRDKEEIERFIVGEGYQSPIRIMQDKINWQIENNIYKAVLEVGVNVDKDELIKALLYDRGQYDRGYRDGYIQARKETAIEFSKKIKSKIKELKQRYHEDYVNGLGDEEYNGLTENNVDEILKEMGVDNG